MNPTRVEEICTRLWQACAAIVAPYGDAVGGAPGRLHPPPVKLSLTQGQRVHLFLGPAGGNLVCSSTGRRSLQAFIGRQIRRISGLKALAPYAAIELLLPGGSLIALGLWLLKHRGHLDRH